MNQASGVRHQASAEEQRAEAAGRANYETFHEEMRPWLPVSSRGFLISWDAQSDRIKAAWIAAGVAAAAALKADS
jgi:hypothetical protein